MSNFVLADEEKNIFKQIKEEATEGEKVLKVLEVQKEEI